MNLNPTLVLQTDYGNGIAFEGEAVHAFVKLLTKARLVALENRNGRYGWHPMDPNEQFDINNRITMLSRPLDWNEEVDVITNRLKVAEERVKKHLDMIEAAEALSGEEES
jgi:hypothetical protein